MRSVRTQYFALLLLTALSGILITACKKDEFNDVDLAEHTSEFAFPLFNTTLNIKDLLTQVLNENIEGDTLIVNPDNTLTLIYTGDVARKPATDIFSDLLTGPPIPLPDTFFRAPFAAPQGVRIYKALLNGGTLQLGVANSTSEVITGTFSVPQMKKNGQVFTIPFTAFPGLPSVSPMVPVDGYLLESDSNKLEFRYEAYRPNGERILLPPINGIPAVFVSFNALTFSYIEGYWEQQVYPLTRDTIDIDINQTDLNGQVSIRNPVVTFTVGNSWGFETRGLIKYLSFLGEDGQEYPLTSTLFNNDSIDFNYPTLNEVGETKVTTVTLDETNSNIGQIFNAQPVRLIYEVCGIANPGNDTTRIGFITDSSLITLGVKVELLLEGSAKDFAADQTIDLNFGDYEDLDTSKIESVEFKLVTENSMPITADVQLYFLDSSGVVIDSLFEGGPQPLIRAAAVNSQGVSTETVRTEHFIPMSISRFNRVRRADQARLETLFTTSDGGTVPVKLLATNQAAVKMGLKVKTRW